MKIINDDCINIEMKADVIHLGYIGNTIDFLEHTHNCLNENGVVIFHEAYRNSWLGFKSRSEWGTVPEKFTKLMDKNKLIETAEKEIVSLETEIKELNKDLDEEKQIRVTLYKEVKVKNAEIELIKKNFSIEREQHQIDIMKKDHEITKLKK